MVQPVVSAELISYNITYVKVGNQVTAEDCLKKWKSLRDRFVWGIEKVNISSIAYESAATTFKVSILSCHGIIGEGGRPEW